MTLPIPITKKELTSQLQVLLSQQAIDATKKDCKIILDTVDHLYTSALYNTINGEYNCVRFNFGQFKLVNVPTRSGVSSFNNKPWMSPAHKTLKFKLNTRFKETIRQATIK